jgi:CelD/BcsL family acetyltransferase involved in cellulose biosynthesis
MNKPAASASFEKVVVPASESKDSAGAPLKVMWRTLRSLAGEIDAWRDLAGRALEPNVFLEPAFALAAASHLPNEQVSALVVYEGERLVGLLPGRVAGLARGRPVATFVAWTHPFAPLSTPLVDRELAPDVIAALLDCLPEIPGTPRVALFPLFPEEGPVAGLIAEHLKQNNRAPSRIDPHARAALVPGQDESSETESEPASEPTPEPSSKKLKELRRRQRRLSEEGALTHETALDPNAVDAALAGYLVVEAAGWKGRSGTAAASDSNTARFLARAVTSLASEGKARIDRLKLNGRTIASTITLFSGDRAWFWKTAFDEAYARHSPGVQLARDLTEALRGDAALKLVDSCAVADHPMIDQLWSRRIAMVDLLVPLASRPAMAVALAGEQLRRAVKRPLKALRNRTRS